MNSMNTVKFKMPEEPTNSDAVLSSLSGFYKDMGWSPETHNLDVRGVKISESNYKKIADMYIKAFKADGKESMGVFMVSYMPSVGEKITDDEVALHDFWVSELPS